MIKTLFIVLTLSILLTACGPQPDDSLTIAAAANTQYAMQELTRAFTEKTGIECTTVTASSGKLTAQIMEGAPFDVFVAADLKYPDELFKNGLTTAVPEVYAYGALVLWTLSDDVEPSVQALKETKINRIALANPKTAPYGRAAVEALKHYQIYEEVKHKLVYGESIAQCSHFIRSGAARIGFTARSLVESPEMQGKGQWREVDTGAHTPIAQGVVIINNRRGLQAQAQRFYAFLFSAEGKEILSKFGYSVSE